MEEINQFCYFKRRTSHSSENVYMNEFLQRIVMYVINNMISNYAYLYE